MSGTAVAANPGWLPKLDRRTFGTIPGVQDTPGDLAEMGVYQGQSAAMIGAHRRPGETVTVVDLFEDGAVDHANAAENAREYAGLTRARCDRNYRGAVGELPVVVQGLSETDRRTRVPRVASCTSTRRTCKCRD